MKRLSADVTEHVSMHVTAQVAVLCMHLHVHPFTHLHLDLFIFYRFIGDKNAEVILNIWMCRWACWKLTCSRICVHLLVPLAHPFPELSGFELSTVAKIYKLSTPSGGFFRKQVCKLIRPHHCFSDNN